MSIKIRYANIFDHTEILNRLLRQLETCPVKYPTYDGAATHWVSNVLTNGYCLVAETDNKLVGICGFLLSKFPWNSSFLILNNEWFFVEEAYRKYGIAKKMLEKAKDYSDTSNVPLLMGINNGELIKEKDKFLEINGVKYVGGNFIYGI
jgi:GNAT superfamily N-acetyltransferase